MLSKEEKRKYLEMVNPGQIQDIPEFAWEDNSFVMLAAHLFAESYKYINKDQIKDRDLFISCFDEAFEVITSEYHDIWKKNKSKEIYKLFELADPKFKNDKELVLEIIGWDEEIYTVIDENLQKDLDVVIEYVSSFLPFTLESRYPAYKKINKEVLNDIEKMNKLIEVDPLLFVFADETLRNNLEFVLKAYSYAIDEAESLTDDISNKIGEELLKDKESAKKLLEVDVFLYYDIEKFFVGDEKEEIILLAIEQAKEKEYHNMLEELNKDLNKVRVENELIKSKKDFNEHDEEATQNIKGINKKKNSKRR